MQKQDFNFGWKFKTEGKEWVSITLPHDAQLLDARRADSEGGSGHGFFVGNVYYYEKEFEAPAEWADEHVEILFEGIYKNSEVKLNGNVIATHRYGYTQFTANLDNVLKYGEVNVIEVKADNSKLPNSRWYSGGGIYRPVSLLTGPKTGIKFQGVKVKTLSINPARISVITDSEEEPEIEILLENKTIERANGKTVEIEIPDVKLWSDENPVLYEAKVTVAGDTETVKFGIRDITWSNKGLFINGEETLLRGGCVHHDNGIVGAASFMESEWRRVRILKEQGFNAIRVSHNPASTAMLEACDYYGMYVMDETFDMWYVRKTKYDYGADFNECWQDDVRTMVERDFNHPSVIMYSIGNEVSEPGKPEGVETGKKIIDFIKNIDSTRAVTGGMNLMIMSNYAKGKGQYDNVDEEQKKEKAVDKDAKNGSLLFNTLASFIGPGMNKAGNSDKVDQLTTPILDALDIAGYNYANGRYPLDGEKHPDRIIVGSETFPYEIGKNWDMVKKYPYLVGDFMWTSWDYIGESGIGAWSYTGGMPFNRPYPWVLGGAGVIDILGNPDSSCDLAKIVWEIEKNPAIGVRPVNHPGVRVSKSVWRGTNAIKSWSWKNCDNNKAIVEVFSASDSVELIINGVSFGKKKIKNYQAMFKVKYEPGTIEAVSYDAKGNKTGKTILQSATGEIKLTLASEKKAYEPGEIAYINFAMCGENGVTDSNSDALVKVTVEGGELLGFGSANPCTREDFTKGEYTTYQGRAQAIVRVGKSGHIKVNAASKAGNAILDI